MAESKDFLGPDWKQFPTEAEVSTAMKALQITPWPLVSPALDELLSILRASHLDGGAVFARFRLSYDPVLHTVGSLNRWQEIGFFEHFLTSEIVRAAVPELELSAELSALELKWTGAFTFAGELAQALFQGGVSCPFKGTAGEAMRLANTLREDLIGERFDEVFVVNSNKAWTPWFGGFTWDATWLGIDKSSLAVWLLCISDTL